MAIIKSAWEIALEKTKDIKVDAQKYQSDALITEGRKLAASFLQDNEDAEANLKARMKGASQDEKALLTKGMVMTCLDNIALPTSKQYKDSFQKLEGLVAIIGNDTLSELVGQLGQFFDQYLSQQDQLTERAKMQYQPKLEEKQEQLRAQYGDDITLKPEQDPDFLKMLSQVLKQLDAQYGGAITNAKEQIRQAAGLDQ